MLKIYCSECGTPTEYSLSKPKFCSGCGNPFSGAKKEEAVVQKVLIQKPTISKKKPIIEVEDYEDNEELEGSEIDQIPDIADLKYDLDLSQEKGQKLGSIIGTSIGGENLFRKNKSYEKIDRKQVLENFAREGGALRPRSRKSTNQAARDKGSKDG